VEGHNLAKNGVHWQILATSKSREKPMNPRELFCPDMAFSTRGLVENSQHDLEQVQADEIKAKAQKGTLLMVFAIWIPTRLWMSGSVSPNATWNFPNLW